LSDQAFLLQTQIQDLYTLIDEATG